MTVDLDALDKLLAAAPTHRHRKGGLYTLLGYAQHSETGDRLAVYRDARGRLWARPAAMFDDGRFVALKDQS